MIVNEINFLFQTCLKLGRVNFLESVCHDTNHHVGSHDDKAETTEDKENPADVWSKWSIANTFWVEFSKHHQPNWKESIEAFKLSVLLNDRILFVSVHEAEAICKCYNDDEKDKQKDLNILKSFPDECNKVCCTFEQSKPV